MKHVMPMNGGIDKDTNQLYIDSEKGAVLARKNCRVVSVDGSRTGINTSMKGMQEIQASFPSGTNRVIGYVEDKEREAGVFFVYNSNDDDDIYVFDGFSVTALNFDNGVLAFDPLYPVQSDIIGDYLIFTDNTNPPRKIRLYNTSYVSQAGKTSNEIQLALKHPTNAPEVALGTDSTKKVNKLVGKTFQFAYYYIYNDYTYSVLSPYSDLLVSSSVFSEEDNTYTDNSAGNYANITYDKGTRDVSTVVLVAREGNTGNWFKVEEYEKPTTASGNRTVAFYNDVAREFISQDKALTLYSDVPLLAKSVVAVQNRVGLANITKGYDKEVDFNYSLAVEYDTVQVSGSETSFTDSSGVDNESYYIQWAMPNAALGDIVTISLQGVYEDQDTGTVVKQFAFVYNFSHVVTQYDIDTGDVPNQLAGLVVDDIVSKENDIITVIYEDNDPAYPMSIVGIDGSNEGSGNVKLIFDGVHNPSFTQTAGYTSTNTYTTLPTGVNTYKSGSYYQVSAAFMDDRSRTPGAVKSQQVYIPHNGERAYSNAFDRAKIKFTLGNYTVPTWATKMKFAVTESINFAGVYPFVTGNNAGGNAYEIFLDGKEVIAISLPENFQYEFINGDYLQLEVDSGSAITSTIVKTIIGTRTLIYDSVGTELSGFWLIVPKGSEDISTYQDNLAYIYRTKNTVSNLVYYECPISYDIDNGVIKDSDGNTVTTGYVGEGDAWFVSRKFEYDNDGSGTVTSATKTVEDFYIDVDNAIRSYSKGRALLEFDTLGQINLQDFVWSEPYLDNTKINGISFFDPENRVQLDEKDGQIQGLELVGFVLKAIQDNKETSIYIGKDEVSNADGSLGLVKSSGFIGTVRAYDTEYGSRFAQSITKHNRSLYYFDSDRGQVIRSSPNGQFPISDYNMKSEFLRIKKDIDNALRTDSRSVNIISMYDIRNDEFVITFDIRGNVETWVFKEGMDEWTEYRDYTDSSGNPPNLYGTIGETAFAFLDNVWVLDKTTSYNTFFGEYKPLSITGVFNIYPTEEKALTAILLDSNRALKTEITTPVTNTRTVGQKSYLYTGTYKKRDGCYTSAVLKNVLVAGGAENINLIHSGTDMVGKYAEIKFTDNLATEFQLRTIKVSYLVNY